MSLLAALCAGVFAYLLVGYVTGYAPRLQLPRRRRASKASARQQWLLQAGVALTPRQFWVGSAAAGVAAFLATAAVTATPAVAVFPAAAVALLPRAYFARQRQLRLREIARVWPEGLRELAASIDVGYSVHQAVTALARSGPEPLRRAFARYPDLARMHDVVPALEIIKQQLADPTSDRVLEVLVLAQQSGGQLVTAILEDLAVATTKDVRTSEEIETLDLEQKINARAVFVLPWLTLLLLTARPGVFRDFYRTGGGLLVILAAAAASLLGMWIVARLSRHHVEQRVFDTAGLAGGPPGDQP